MQDVIDSLMANRGVVKRDIEATFFGKKLQSRGYYIAILGNHVWYLHHDGSVKEGVEAASDKPAFWPTESEAQEFFDNWKNALISSSRKPLSEQLGLTDSRPPATSISAESWLRAAGNLTPHFWGRNRKSGSEHERLGGQSEPGND